MRCTTRFSRSHTCASRPHAEREPRPGKAKDLSSDDERSFYSQNREELGAEGGVELRHQAALAAGSIVLVDHVLGVGAIYHADGASHSLGRNILIAGGNCHLGLLDQRASGGSVCSVFDALAIVRSNSLARRFAISHVTAFPDHVRNGDK